MATANATFDALMANYRDLPADEVRATICATWSHTSWPALTNRYEDLLDLFRWCWYTTDDSEELPREDLTIYRAETTDTFNTDGAPDLGVLWTTDPDVATLYAVEYSVKSDAVVMVAHAPRRAVLARFTFESEVVVEPSMLTTVQVFTTVPRIWTPQSM